MSHHEEAQRVLEKILGSLGLDDELSRSLHRPNLIRGYG
jgi:hypothetical protein